jgi:hypothetical protein
LRMGGGVVRYKLLSLPKNRSGSGGSGSAGTFQGDSTRILSPVNRGEGVGWGEGAGAYN